MDVRIVGQLVRLRVDLHYIRVVVLARLEERILCRNRLSTLCGNFFFQTYLDQFYMVVLGRSEHRTPGRQRPRQVVYQLSQPSTFQFWIPRDAREKFYICLDLKFPKWCHKKRRAEMKKKKTRILQTKHFHRAKQKFHHLYP